MEIQITILKIENMNENKKDAQVAPPTPQQNTSVAKTSSNVGDSVIKRVDEMVKIGFTMPKDYNHVNAIKASMLKIQDLKDKNGVPALEVCTPNSIAGALFKMATYGLDASKRQGDFIVRGKELCFDPEYFGRIVMAQRASSKYKPIAHVIWEGDIFEYGYDKEGRTIIFKHETKLENKDKAIVGAYAYVHYEDGSVDIDIMTKKQIDMAWAKSPTQLTTHKQFPEDMAKKTVITRSTKILINSSINNSFIPEDTDYNQPIDVAHEDVTYAEFDETPAEIAQVSEVKEAVVESIPIAEPEPNKSAKELF